jgi:hypothetical protein
MPPLIAAIPLSHHLIKPLTTTIRYYFEEDFYGSGFPLQHSYPDDRITRGLIVRR